jgi:hypothetical protein
MAAYLQQDTLVRLSAGAYTTSTVKGCRASSTGGAQLAAELLGRKLFGEDFHVAERVADVKLLGVEHWRLFYRRPEKGAPR